MFWIEKCTQKVSDDKFIEVQVAKMGFLPKKMLENFTGLNKSCDTSSKNCNLF